MTEVRIACSTRDGAGHLWRSENGFLVSRESRFDTGSTPGFGDDYYGVAAEGPIYSMRCQTGFQQNFLLPRDGQITFMFELLEGNPDNWKASTVRHSSIAQRDNLEIVIFSFHNSTPAAHHGCSLLESLGYKVECRAISLDDTDLTELLGEVREAGSIHLVSSGRASEVALEIAQRAPKLKSVSVFSGSGLRFNPWKIKGQELPYSHCELSSLDARGQNVLRTRKAYAEAVASRANRERGQIVVEKIRCPIYLFSGSDDQVWPSAAFSELVAQRRGEHGLKDSTYHRTFPSVGHDLGPELGLPGLPTTERTKAYEVPGLRLALGGKMGRQSRARRECWTSLLEILQGKSPRD